MNRKKVGNSKKSSSELRAAFADIETEEYERLYKNSLLNNANFNAETYGAMEQEISIHLQRDVHFPGYREKASADLFDRLTANTDVALLYRQCVAQRDGHEKIDILLHKIGKPSPEYAQLFKWRKFIQSTQPFIKPVHFQLGAGKNLSTTLSGESATMNATTLLQNKLIQSHTKRKVLALAAFIEPLETLLDVSMIKALFYRDLVILFFEWLDPMPFVFLMAFSTEFDKKSFAHTLSRKHDTAYVLTRKDVVPELGQLVIEEEEKEKEDDDDGVNDAIEVEEEEEEGKIQVISSECADGDSMIESLKKSVQHVFISYITSGYVKRE